MGHCVQSSRHFKALHKRGYANRYFKFVQHAPRLQAPNLFLNRCYLSGLAFQRRHYLTNPGISTYFPLWTPHGILRPSLRKIHFLSLLYPSGSTTWQAKRTSNVIGSTVLSSTTTHVVIRCVCQACRLNLPRGRSSIVCTIWALKLASMIGQGDGFFILLLLELSLVPTVTICHKVHYRSCQFIPQLRNILIHVPLRLWANCCWRPERPWCLHRHGQDVQEVQISTFKTSRQEFFIFCWPCISV